MTEPAAYTRPLPVVNQLNRPHWEAARRGEFLLQRCSACGHLQFPPLPNCSSCLGEDMGWVQASGRGTVFSFIVYHQGWLPGYREEVPYNVAIVELDEGVRLINNIIGVSNDDLRIGMRVEAVFEEVAPDVTIPRFHPAGD